MCKGTSADKDAGICTTLNKVMLGVISINIYVSALFCWWFFYEKGCLKTFPI